MSWKFWQKKAVVTAQASLEWPTDSYKAVTMLGALFASRDLPPFSNWRPADAELSPDTENLAEFSTKALQLALWFWQFRQVHGDIAARMARDACCLFLDDLSEGAIGEQAEALLNIIDTTRKSFEELPEEKRQFAANGESVDLPFHWFLALAILTQVSDSPFYGKGADIGDADMNLAMCLSHGSEEANTFWEPMLARIGPFNPASYPAWKWSEQPGAFERHLQRRHGNPLFTLDRRSVSAPDVYYARLRDAQALQALQRNLSDVFSELKKADLPFDWFPYLNDLRERLDDLYDQLQQAGGDEELEQLWRDMRNHIIQTWRAAIGTNGESVDALNRAEAMVKEGREARAPWLHQVSGPGKPIPPEEVAASLLTEPLEDIIKSIAWLGHDEEALSSLRDDALRCVMHALAEGYQIPKHREKLAAIGVAI